MSDPGLNSQARILALVEALAIAGRDGMSNKEIIVVLKQSGPTVCRDLAVLEKQGWVERTINGAWRLSPKFGGLSGMIARTFREARLRLSEDEARYASAMQ